MKGNSNMEVDSPSSVQRPPSYTIVRIKRKRTDEPLDALVVDRPRRKKSKGGLNIFQFAGTVEKDAWDDAQQKKELESRISALAREPASSGPAVLTNNAPVSTPPRAPATTSPLRTRSDEPGRQYTIVRTDTNATVSEPGTRQKTPTAPPKVWSTKELEAIREAKASFKMYDAVPSSSSLGTMDSTSTTSTGASTDDPEMAKFLPMLQDYLKLHDSLPPTESASSMSVASSKDTLSSRDDDYVWDVFYQRPTTFQGLYTPSSSTSGNIATLVDVPPELFEFDDSDDESDVEDEADEDSNAEDWYTNDYPEEDDDRSEYGSDVFHENSDYEEVVHGVD